MNKYILVCLSVIFVVFGILQLNDPDPLLWVIIYWSVAILGMFVYKGPINSLVIMIISIILGVYACSFIVDFFTWIRESNPTLTGKMLKENPNVELIKEFFGLIIAELGLFYIYLQNKHQREQRLDT